jgi:hypothetical protein
VPTKISLDRDSEAFSEYLASLHPLISTRRVRPVVTRSGARARGFVPSLKAPECARFESNVERDMLRVLEVASLPKVIHTHPFVMALSCEPGVLHYTPDVVVEFESGGAIIEVKGGFFLSRPEQRARLAKIASHLRREGVMFIVITESDIRIDGLQQELAELLRARPLVMHGGAGLDTAAWDPLHRPETDIEAEQRWLAAQRECDALLERVMRRDPDELLPMTC